MKKSLFQEVAAQAQNRRGFVRKLALAGSAGAAALGSAGKAQASCGFNDVDLLQFMLNMEYLLAEFYSVATTGKPVDWPRFFQGNIPVSGPTSGGQVVHDLQRGSGMGYLQQIANELAIEERGHTFILASIIGDYYSTQPVAKPAINLDGWGSGMRSANEFLRAARMLEDLIVSAYSMALFYLTRDVGYGFSTLMLASECQHSGNLRAQCGALSVPTSEMDCSDYATPPSGYYFPTDINGLTPWRDPGELLYLLYGNKVNADSGGFFPDGMNGFWSTSTTSDCNK